MPEARHSITDWPARWAALGNMDDDAGDRESVRLYGLWDDEYQAAFIAKALERGWTRENAETWAHEIVVEARITHAPDKTPQEAAAIDIIECEWETYNGV